MEHVPSLFDEGALAAEAGAAASPAPADALTVADVARIVPESAPPPPPSALYRLALASVAAVAGLLALVYLALVAGAAWALWLHVATNTGNIGTGKGEMRPRSYAVLAALLIAVLVLLLRPLIAGKQPPSSSVTAEPGDEPVLHAFVGRVARAVGAPVPRRIDVDADVNASASFRRGVRSFGGDDLVLTLGAPLVAGTTVEELAGVLAHELGHFRQGLGMRLTYVARTLESWFERVAFQRDRWDEAIDKVGWAFGAVQLVSWLLRKLFHGMLLLLRRAERLASRRMEIDADDHALALVGGPPTIATLRKVVLLDAAHGRSLATAQSAYENGRLPDDLPALVLGWRSRMDAGTARTFLDAALSETTDAAATHPCVRERAERAARVGPGPLRCDRPARTLLRAPDALFREVTARRFHVVTDGKAKDAKVVPADELLGGEDAELEARRALARWGQGVLSYLVLPRVGAWLGGSPVDAATARELVCAARDDLVARAPAARAATRSFDDADTRVVEALRVEAVLAAKGNVRKLENMTVLTDRTQDGVRAALAGASAAQRSLRAQIDPALDALGLRVRGGLALLAGRPEEDAVRADLASLAALGGALGDVEGLRTLLPAEYDLVQELAQRENKKAEPQIVLLAEKARVRLARIREHLVAAGATDAADAVAPALAPSAGPGDVLDAARKGVGAYYDRWFTIARRIAVVLEAAETAAGLEPLAAPADGP